MVIKKGIVAKPVAPSKGAVSPIAKTFGLGSSKPQVSQSEEEVDLNNARLRAVSRVTLDPKLKYEPEKQKELVNNILGIANRGENAPSKWSNLVGGIKTVGGPILGGLAKAGSLPAVKQIFVADAYVGRGIQSLALDAATIAMGRVYVPLNKKLFNRDLGDGYWYKDGAYVPPTFHGWLNRVKDKEWGVFGSGEDQVSTGNKTVDGLFGFGAMAWASPMSHIGAGSLSTASRSGKYSLATQFSTKEMVAKYPVLAEAGVVDKIARYGPRAIPKQIRDAEGIETGLRLYGGVVKGTGLVEEAWMRSGGVLRAKIGDVVFNNKTGAMAGAFRNAGEFMTPKYASKAVAAGVGRGRNLPLSVVEKELSVWSSMKHAKGANSVAYTTWSKPLVELAKRQRELAGVGVRGSVGQFFGGVVDIEAKNLYRYLEMSAADLASAKITPELKQLVTDVKSWQDGIRQSVNQGATEFGIDASKVFGETVNTRQIGFLDDYVHHSLSKKSKQWLLSENGTRVLGTAFKEADINVSDLTNPNSPIMFRKLRAPYVDDKGVRQVATFFGQEIQTGTIDEINNIFKTYLRKQGVAEKDLFDWFETDFAMVADSYASSMARAKGREAFARRAMDFSTDIIKPMLKDMIPDGELVTRLEKLHAGLSATQTSLRGTVQNYKGQAAGLAKLQIKNAKDFLTGQRVQKVLTTRQIAKLKSTLDKLTVDLADAARAATSKDAALRGDFAVVHQAMVDEIANLQVALQNPDRYAATQELKAVYSTMYPNHNPVLLDQKSPEWLAEKIINGRGQAQAREIRIIKSRQKELRDVIDSLPDGAEGDAMRQQLESQFYDLVDGEQAFTVLGDVRSRATYSDGFVYGTTEDIRAVPRGAKDFNVMRTKPTEDGFDSFPSSVAVHAPDEDSLVDLRNPEFFGSLFNTGDNSLANNIAGSLEQHGMPELGVTLREQTALYNSSGAFSPEFEQAYPELAQLIETIKFHGKVPRGTAVGEELISGALEDIQYQLHSVIPAVEPDDVDTLARSILEKALGDHLHNAVHPVSGSPLEGMVVPQGWFDDAIGDPNLAGEHAVLMRTDISVPQPDLDGTSPVQYVAENDFVQDVLGGRYEEKALNATLARSAKEQEITDLINSINMRSSAQDELKSLAGRKGGLTKAQNARVAKAQKAKEMLQATETVEVVLGGQKKIISRTQAQEMIATRTSQVSRGYIETEKMIEKAYADLGLKAEKIAGREKSVGEDLAIMFNQGRVLKTWSNTTGLQLQRDIQDIRVLLRSQPPKGAAGGETSAWLRKVDRSMQNIKNFGDPNVAKAYERVTALLHSNEAKLARLEMVAIPAVDTAIVNAKNFGTLVDVTEEGWQEIYGLGVQMPEELLSVWKPNLDKLRSVANRNIFNKSYREAMNFFKTYATSSVGFFTRNGFSATYMNWVAGVDPEHTIMGFRAARAIGKGPEDWAKFLSGLPPEQAAIYETAWKITEATGRGAQDELKGAVIRGSFGERITNNAYTRAFQNKNNFVERAVRLPMAIDSLTKGNTYDQAVARISRYHFDYSDVSGLDEAAKTLIPFWTWTSRNVPLQIVEQWTHPAAYITYERIKEGSPVGEDVPLPSYVSDWGPTAIGGVSTEKKSINIDGMEMVVSDVGGQWLLTPDLPNTRLEQQLMSLIDPRRLIGQMAPFPKVLVELAAGRQLGIDVGPFKTKKVPAQGLDALVLAPLANLIGGEALVGKDKQGRTTIDERVSYIVQNILPTLAQMNRVTGGATGGKASYNERQLANILNWFGIPVRYVGPQQQASEQVGRKIKTDNYISKLVEDGVLTKQK